MVEEFSEDPFDNYTSLVLDNDTILTETNGTDINYALYAELYKNWVPLLMIFCIASLIVNIKVLLTIHWLRRPISPTVYISLSLAAADAVSSLFLGVHLLVNGYINYVYLIQVPCYIAAYTVEIYRLSGIITTVLHLLALSINHWLGIWKPLHYASIMTSKKTTIIVFFLWMLPIIFFNFYFYSHEYCDIDFIGKFKFRIIFSFLFFIPLSCMIVFYTHILLIVKAQRERWASLERSGSKRNKAIAKSNSQQRRTMENNIKAITTTLFILGSCLIGWMPSVAKFILICNEGCPYTTEQSQKIGLIPNFVISYMAYFLVIAKTMANPIIYSTRMTEVKEATKRMNQAICGIICRRHSRDDNPFETQTFQLGCSGSTRGTCLRHYHNDATV